MANAIKTVMTYNLNGSTKDFNIPFEYLARKFITVTLIGKDRKVLVLNQDYRFSTKTTVSTTKAWAVADGYTTIEIRRYTSATERLVDYADGSILRAYDLNISQVQTLHVAEEARDLTADTIGVNNDGNLDARGRRIVNTANAVDRGDAINYGQVLDMSNGAYQSFQNAQAQAQEATRQQQEATRQQGIATQQAQSSAASASASKTSETNASASNTAAAAARDLAQKWASAARNVVVQSGLYSAYHWALNAADSAAQALGFRDTTKGYMDTAAASVTAATTQADRAKTEADKLANFNGLAGAIDSVDNITVKWKGPNWFPQIELASATPYIDFHYANSTADYTHRLIADSDTTLTASSSFRVNGNFFCNGTINGYGEMAVNGRASFNNRVDMISAYVSGNASSAMNRQGMHMVWNEGGDGRGSIVVNRGQGAGGLNFRFVDLGNTTSSGTVQFQPDGSILAKNITAQGGTIRASGDVYAGAAHLGTDGNIYDGTAFTGNLKGWLQNSSNLMQSFNGRVKGWNGVNANYLDISVDGNGYGINMFASDADLKTNVVQASADKALEDLCRFVLTEFDIQTFAKGPTTHQEYGFIAQQVEDIIPSAIFKVEGGFRQVNLLPLVAALIGSVQALNNRVKQLEASSKE